MKTMPRVSAHAIKHRVFGVMLTPSKSTPVYWGCSSESDDSPNPAKTHIFKSVWGPLIDTKTTRTNRKSALEGRELVSGTFFGSLPEWVGSKKQNWPFTTKIWSPKSTWTPKGPQFVSAFVPFCWVLWQKQIGVLWGSHKYKAHLPGSELRVLPGTSPQPARSHFLFVCGLGPSPVLRRLRVPSRSCLSRSTKAVVSRN